MLKLSLVCLLFSCIAVCLAHECKDDKPYCNRHNKESCATYWWLKQHCRKFCGLCDECIDVVNWCDRHRSQCNLAEVSEVCRKTCGLCGTEPPSAFECGPALDSLEQESFSNANLEFGKNFYINLCKRQQEPNILFSPVSISMALGMVMGGARGNTLEQMQNVLYPHPKENKIGPAFSQLMQKVNEIPETDPRYGGSHYMLKMANAMFLQEGYELLPKFRDRHMKRCLASDVKERNFEANPEEIRNEVNDYIADKTGDMITNMLPPRSVDRETRMLLANVLYLNVSWQNSFHGTKQGEFKKLYDEPMTVDYMEQTDYFNYVSDGPLEMLEMPYVGGSLSMYILLRNCGSEKPEGFDRNYLETELLGYFQKKMLVPDLRHHRVTVTIPKFKIDFNVKEAKDILMDMGIEDLFTYEADLSGMAGRKDLYVDQVFHKAVLEANEAGTVASAATVMKGSKSSQHPPTPIFFSAECPFMFALYHHEAKSVLFLGSVFEPRYLF